MSEHKQELITIDALKHVSVYKAIIFIILFSSFAFLFLIWLIYFKETAEDSFQWVSRLPSVNATFNSISTVLLIIGYVQIRRRNFERHMQAMIGAFLMSTLFLVSYVIYHHFVGHTPFPGTGFIRPVYFTILISHIILSALVVPLILSSFYLAFSGKLSWHRKVSKFTFPVWIYVSVTGVLIYFILNAYV